MSRLTKTSLIGGLTDRVKVQYPNRSQPAGGRGVASVTWVDSGSVWANVKTTNQAEDPQGRALVATATHVVTVRYRSDITQLYRLIWRGKTLNIISVIDDDNRKVWLTLICGEEVL